MSGGDIRDRKPPGSKDLQGASWIQGLGMRKTRFAVFLIKEV
jgi:hypothetical protein